MFKKLMYRLGLIKCTHEWETFGHTLHKPKFGANYMSYDLVCKECNLHHETSRNQAIKQLGYDPRKQKNIK